MSEEKELYVYADGEGGVETAAVTPNDLRAVLSGQLPTSRAKQRELIGILLNAKNVNLSTILDEYATILTKSKSDKMRLAAGDRLLELLGVTGKETESAAVTVNIAPIDTQTLSDDDIRREYQRRMMARQRGLEVSEVPLPAALPAFEQCCRIYQGASAVATDLIERSIQSAAERLGVLEYPRLFLRIDARLHALHQ